MKQTQTKESEFIATIYSDFSDNFDENFREICSNKTIRAVVLVYDFEEVLQIDKSLLELIRNCRVPVIIALKKSVSKVNFEIAQAAHLCVASGAVKFILPEKNTEISAREALKLGLINNIVPIEEVENEAFAMAEKIKQLAPLATRACLQAVIQGLEMPLEDGLKLETELFSRIFASRDMRVGIRAFLEKRQPVFHGE
ncbi:MAG: hypothetical protein H0V31_01490 [Acidobacteria bacterium]|jgi:enoyl-CoA hydratase/carnithine racemase|nr:hypothetical protein [Acidobacteriota bacterium]